MRQHKHWLKTYFAALALSVLCMVSGGHTEAASATQSVAQSYQASGTIQNNVIVQLANKAGTQVSAATLADDKAMLGVTISADAAPVTLSSDTSSGTQQVYVASSGRYDVLVSDQNGSVAVGDYVTVSSLSGVGMKATDQAEVLGRAATLFDGHHNVAGTTSLHDQTGRKVNVAIGRVAVDIAIGPNPLAGHNTGYVPAPLRQVVSLITDKPLSAWRIYLSLFIFLVALFTAASLLYGGVRSGMTAIGRNPLARGSIMRNLFQVVVTSTIMVLAGAFITFIILKV